MKKLQELKAILAEHKPEIQKKFKVKGIGIFGSYVRGGQKRKSDVDVLVEFSEPVGLFEFMDLEEYLQSLFGVKVDLVSKKTRIDLTQDFMYTLCKCIALNFEFHRASIVFSKK